MNIKLVVYIKSIYDVVIYVCVLTIWPELWLLSIS